MMRELMRGLFVLWMGFSLVGGCCFGAAPFEAAPFVAAEDGGAARATPAPLDPALATRPAGSVAATEPPPIEPGQRATELWLEPRLSEDAWRALERAPVPQVAGALSLFEAAPPHEGGALERALVICRTMMVPGHDDWDGIFGGPEIQLQYRIGNGSMRATPEGRPPGVFTFPIDRVRPRDRVWVRLVDEDVLFDDTIAEGSTHFAGTTPFVVSMRRATLECRAVTGERVERAARGALAQLDRTIARVERAQPDAMELDSGYPSAEVVAIRDAASGVAAWLDWSNPELRERITRAIAIERAWDEAAAREVEHAVSELPDATTLVPLGGGRDARVARLECGARAVGLRGEIDGVVPESPGPSPCLAVLEVRARAGWSLGPLPSDGAIELRAVDATGRSHPLTWLARRRAGQAWHPAQLALHVPDGERVEIVLAVPVRDARLFWARDERGGRWLLRAP